MAVVAVVCGGSAVVDGGGEGGSDVMVLGE